MVFILCRKLFVELCKGHLQPSISHPFRKEEELFLIFDFTHNFKNIYNNFVNRKVMNPHISGYDEILGKSCTAKFEHVHRLYSLEEDKSLKIACDLKKASLYPSSLARTSPQHALGKFYQISEIL